MKMDGRLYNYGPGTVQKETYDKVSISKLQNSPMYPVVSGVVIAKSDSRFVATKRGERYVCNFTIRDSPQDVINASCWGDEIQVKAIKETFTIGDVVKIKNPQVVAKQPDSKNDKYRPYTSCPFELLVSPLNSEIIVSFGPEEAEFKHLLRYPIHSPKDFYSVADVVCNSQNFDGATVNLLVAIKKIGALEHMVAKEGRPLKKLEIQVFDKSHSSFSVVIWDGETANFIKNYFGPRKLVLISDIRVNFSRFVDGMMATAVSNTVFTPDPDVPDSRILLQYAARVSIEDNPSTNGGELRTYTIDELYGMTATGDFSMSEDIIGIVYAYISNFDIDGVARVVSRRCPECRRYVSKNNGRCANGNCEVGSGMKETPAQEVFDMMLRLSDHTGSLDRCSVFGPIAENLLKCTVQEYKSLTIEQKTTLKWQNLFELFKVNFKIPRGTAAYPNPIIRITSIARAGADDLLANFKQT